MRHALLLSFATLSTSQPWLCISSSYVTLQDATQTRVLSTLTPSSCLSNQAFQPGTEVTLLGGDLEVAVDDGDCQQNTCSTSQRTQHVARHGQCTNTCTTKRRRSRNHPLQLLVHRLLPVPGHNEPLILERLCHITRCRARYFDPRLGEHGARDNDEGDVDDGVDGVEERIGEAEWRGHVVCETTAGEELGGAFLGFPRANELNEEVVGETSVEHLADHEDVGGEGGLQHDGHIGGVEQADGVGAAHAPLAGGLDGDFDAEALQVDDGCEDGESGQEVHDVGKVLSVEGFTEGACLVGPCHQQVEKSDDCSFEFFATACVDGGRREGLPDN